MSSGGGFVVALGFLSRLGPAKRLEPGELASGLVYFPAVGLILGLLLALPFAFGFLPGHFWIQAWVLLGGILWLTRGLHWDGWCDVWDAWGAGATGEDFFRIIKDSRAGAFGVVATCMGLFGELFLLQEVLAIGAYHILPWALLLGRGSAAFLAVASRNMSRPGLAGQFLGQARPWMLVPVILQVLVAGAVFASPSGGLLALALTGVGLIELYSLARRNGALNGDFLGAAVIWGELAALLAWNLTGAGPDPGILDWWHLL